MFIYMCSSFIFFFFFLRRQLIEHIECWLAFRRMEDSLEIFLSGASELSILVKKNWLKEKTFKLCFMFFGWITPITHYWYFSFYFFFCLNIMVKLFKHRNLDVSHFPQNYWLFAVNCLCKGFQSFFIFS